MACSFKMACSLPSGESINEEFLSCPICSEVFDEELYTPRNLQCGHTICSLCVDKVIQSLYKHCPECRKVIDVRSSTDLPICYIATRIVRNTKKQKLDVKETQPPPAIDLPEVATPTTSDSDGLDVLKSVRTKLASEQPLKNVSISLDALFGSDNYMKRIDDRTKHEVECIGDRIIKLKAEMTVNDTNIQNIKSYLSHEEMRVQKMSEFRSLFEDLKSKIAHSKTITDLDELIEEVLETNESAEALFNDDQDLCSLEQFIGNRVITEHFNPCRQVYAEQVVNGIKKYARISQCGDHIILHVLKALPQPHIDSNIIKYSEVYARVPRHSTATLYLYWDGWMQGAIKFALNNCRHGHHFASMCLGDLGKSFLNAVLFGSLDGGVLSSHPALSGASLVSTSSPSSSLLPNCVRAASKATEGRLLAQVLEPTNVAFGAFKIDMQKKQSERGPVHVFGECVGGLNVLRALAARKTVDDVIVKSSGVIVESL